VTLETRGFRTASGLVALLALTPWPLGARLPWATLLSVALVVALSLGWLYATWRRSEAADIGWPFVAVAGYLCWTGGLILAGYAANRHAAAIEWSLHLAYALVFLLAQNLARQSLLAERLRNAIVVVGLAVGVFGLVQLATSNGLVYWVYDPPFGGTPFGPFNNRNYFAGYMLAVLGPAFGIVVTEGRRRPLIAYFSWLGALATLATLSRTGAIGLAAVVIAAFWFGRSPRPRGGWERWAWPVGAGGAMVLGLSILNQTERVVSRLETLLAFQQDTTFAARLDIWRAAWAMFEQKPLTGWGLGSFGWVMPGYRIEARSSIATHAHNEYLEVLAETGSVGAILCAAAVVLVVREGTARLRNAETPSERGVRAGALAALCGALVFSMADFPLIIPAIGYVLAALAGIVIAPMHSEGERS
jgi:O-antigen ligase